MDFQSRLFIVSQHLSSHPPPILFQSNSPQLCTVTLNRPQSLNAINIDMMDHLSFLLPTLNHHQVTWLQGSGGKAFCAGGDVKSLFSTHTSRE
jgi:enoyl-CoA hydratase/carnithine racemase